MTAADLAAALGVPEDLAGRDGWDDPCCRIGRARWVISQSPSRDSYHGLNYDDPVNEVEITVPITTTLTAAVARVRRMLDAYKENP